MFFLDVIKDKVIATKEGHAGALCTLINLAISTIMISWPLMVLQSIFRVAIITTCIHKLGLSYIALAPLILLVGAIYDALLCAHASILLVVVVGAIPLPIRLSYAGKIIIIFIIGIFSSIFITLLCADFISWTTLGVRLGAGGIIYGTLEMLNIVSTSGLFGNMYIKYCSILICFALPIFILTRVMLIFVLHKCNISTCRFTKVHIGLVAFAAISILSADLYHSRFDMASAVFQSRIHMFSNRYVSALSQNSIHAGIINSLSSMWSTFSLYASIPSCAKVQKLAQRILIRDSAPIADFQSSQTHNVNKPSIVRAYNTIKPRKNAIVILLDDIYPSFKSKGKIEILTNEAEISLSLDKKISNMPYVSRVLNSDDYNSIVFSNAYASSQSKKTSFEVMMFSSFSGGQMPSGGLPELLNSHGYESLFFYNKKNNFLSSTADVMRLEGNRSATPHGVIDLILHRADEAFEGGNNFFYVVQSSSITDQENNFFSLFKKKSQQHLVDNAIKRIFEGAKKSSWFDDTFFVFVGSSAGKNKSTLTINPQNHLMYWFIVEPVGTNGVGKVIDTITSHIDFAPTIASAMGVSFVSKFLGSNALDTNLKDFAVIASGGIIGYVTSSHLFVLAPHKRVEVYEKRLDLTEYYQKHALGSTVSSILKNEKLLVGTQYCQDCSYANLFFHKEKLGWYSTRPYWPLINKEALLYQSNLEESLFVEATLLQIISANQLILMKPGVGIKYNNLHQDVSD